MKTTCTSCGKKVKLQDDICPNCGHYHSGSAYSAHPVGGDWPVPPSYDSPPAANRPPAAAPTPVPQYRSQPKTAAVPLIVAAVLVAVLLVMVISLRMIGGRQTAPDSAGWSGGAPAVVELGGDVGELKRLAREQPENSELATQWLELLCYHQNKNWQEEAADAVALLYAGNAEASRFRRAGQALEAAEEYTWACQLYLTAYSVSGKRDDLQLAERCASPQDVLEGPTARAMEIYLGVPLRQITWEQVGAIRYASFTSEQIDLAPVTPADAGGEELFAQQVTSYSGGEGSAAYIQGLYNLEELRVENQFPGGSQDFAGFPQLRVLHLGSCPREMTDLKGLQVLPGLESLAIQGSSLTSLEGLQSLPGLKSLSLQKTGVSSGEPLESVATIQHLTLIDNSDLHDLTFLELLQELKSLHLERQDSLDILFLMGFPQLEELTLVRTGTKDFYPVTQLENLKSLTLTDNSDLKSIQGIGNLTSLESLIIDAKMEGAAEIGQLTELRYLRMNSAQNLNMLYGLDNLETLHLYGSGVLDTIQPVASLTNLRSFTLSAYSSSISYYFSLAPLAQCPNLEYLSLGEGSYYESADAILNMPGLKYLDISGSYINMGSSNFSGLTGIETLKLSGVKPLRNVQIWSDGFFTSIDWDRVEIDTLVGSLSGLSNLQYLDLSGTGLSDLTFLNGMNDLKGLDLSDNYIVEIPQLSAPPRIADIDFSGNPLRNPDSANEYPWGPLNDWQPGEQT